MTEVSINNFNQLIDYEWFDKKPNFLNYQHHLSPFFIKDQYSVSLIKKTSKLTEKINGLKYFNSYNFWYT